MSKGADLSGLDNFNVSSLLGGDKKAEPINDGQLSYAPIDRFIEDDNNARQTYDPDKLKELADSIKAISPVTKKITGIKQPLSVKRHPEKEGYFIINGGHRRYRAAKMVGLKELPYFISDENDELDNVVDNLIREGLKPDEVARFIDSRIVAGDKKGDIAKRLGKPLSYVSDHSVFFRLDDSIKSIYEDGYCESIQGLAKLYRAFKDYPDEITRYCNSLHQKVSVSDIEFFIKSLKEKDEVEPEVSGAGIDEAEPEVSGAGIDEAEPEVSGAGMDEAEPEVSGAGMDEAEPEVSGAGQSVTVRVSVQGDKGELLLKPCEKEEDGQTMVWVKFDNEEEPIKVVAMYVEVVEILN